MAKEGITPAGHAGFEEDISEKEMETLLRGFLDALVDEQRIGSQILPNSTPTRASEPKAAAGVDE